MNRLYRLSLFLAAASLFTVPLQVIDAAWWNPVSWFDGDGERMTPEERRLERVMPLMQPPTPEEERQAAELFARAQELQERGRLSGARSRYRRIVKDFPRTLPAPESQFQIARIVREKGNRQRAFNLLQRTIRRYPDYEGFNRVIGEQFDIASELIDRKRRILFVIPFPRPYERARNYFEQVIANAPYSDYAPLALMNIAYAADAQNTDIIAIDALDRLISFYPNSMLSADAYFMLGEIHAELVSGAYYDQASTRQAISYYEDFLVLYPTDNLVSEAEEGLADMEEVLARSKFILGDFYHRYRKNEPAALVYYNEAITVAPNARAAELSRQRIASIEAGNPPPSVGLGIGKLWQRLGSITPWSDGRDEEDADPAFDAAQP